ncbi:OmpA family protein [Pseudaestuariivita rosea]|uniref:OmpA family protein n=1 Tax=Pseudaestuariivita rosea TaxID=2763263 RepID=UPI001ABAB163|nr:OmpA family protein [Pseudaestuariivita rosea]
MTPRISLIALTAALISTAAFAQDAADPATSDSMAKPETMEKSTDAPNLEDIAASDPALAMRKGEDGEADAMVMLSDVLFDFGTADLNPSAVETLKTVSDKLAKVETLEIKGHTDAIGSDAYNQALGQQRAEIVRAWIVENSDMTADKIIATGVGAAEPIAANAHDDGSDNPNGRAQNRRVEFVLPN